MTIPVFDALRERWPGASIELIGYPRTNRLALAAGIVNTARSLDDAETAALFVRDGLAGTPFADHVASFDLVISFLSDRDETIRGNLEKACCGMVSALSPGVAGMHATDHFLQVLNQVGIARPADLVPRIRLVDPTFPEALSPEGRTVSIHPGSGSPLKNWPAAGFRKVALTLKAAAGINPVFTFGEADSAAKKELAGATPGIPVVESRDLVEHARLLSGCAGYLGNDSGITHLAAAVGIPVVALFGPTDPAVWAPRGDNVTVIRSREFTTDGLAKIDPATVAETVLRVCR